MKINLQGININIKKQKGTTYTITKKEAERILREHPDHPLDIRCREVDMENRSEDDKDWVGIYPEDIGEDGKLPEEWKKFQIWN